MWNWILGGLATVFGAALIVLFCLNYEVSIDREQPAPPPVVPAPPPRIACRTCISQALAHVPLAAQGSQVLAEAGAACADANCQP